MNDKELLKYCFDNFKENTFTGNDIVIELNCSNNIHLQLFRLYKKNLIIRSSRNNQTIYRNKKDSTYLS